MGSDKLETPSNAVLMHKDLIPLFNDNAFSVDIDVRLQASSFM